MSEDAALERLLDQVRAAAADGRGLLIRGGLSKSFYGEPGEAAEELDVRPLRGISAYEPSELVVTARAGTPLAELEAALAGHGQCLPFEPPRFGDGGTVGGMVAAGLSGPARAAVGSVRDYVLGATLINGRGELLGFGGQVMKNVAGYDVSRLLAGSMGILGVIAEVSLKVLPVPPAQATLRFELDERTALRLLNEWGAQPLPLNASAWWNGVLLVRLAGAAAAVEAACARLGGERVEPVAAQAFWAGLRDQRDEYFAGCATHDLWRLSVPVTTPPLSLPGSTLIEWGGGQRWVLTESSVEATGAPAGAGAGEALREAARRAGGHATLFRARTPRPGVFQPLDAVLERVHRELKQAFDPARVFNRGRLLPGL